ncbi:sensor histidine kinase [Candidatus Omnitrophota bacterium]
MFNSIRFKITVLFTTVLGVILLLYSSYLYFNLSKFVYYEVDKKLTEKVKVIDEFISKYAYELEQDYETTPESVERVMKLISTPRQELFQASKVKEIDEEWIYKIHELGLKDDYVIVYYPSGDVAEQTENIIGEIFPVLQKNFTEVPQEALFIKDSISDILKLRIVTKPFFRESRVRYIIQLATSMDAVLFRIKKRFAIIFLSIPVMLFLISLLGWSLVVKILQPITDIRRAAEAITHRDMSKRVGQTLADEEIVALVDAFNDMISRLEKSFQYIQEFSYDVAHELRTPLAIIRGEAEVALRRERSAEEYKRALGVCMEETGHMLKMVEDLLLLTKLEYQADAIEFEPLDLNKFMTEVHEQSKLLVAEKETAISLALPKRSQVIQANKIHLRRLFFNLIDNAIKFTPSKGRIDLCISYENKQARISVADNGVGIADKDLPKLMKRFFHRENTEVPSEAGHGLGLSLVHYIAKAHQGGVEVKSMLGHGSTFTIILPLA